MTNFEKHIIWAALKELETKIADEVMDEEESGDAEQKEEAIKDLHAVRRLLNSQYL